MISHRKRRARRRSTLSTAAAAAALTTLTTAAASAESSHASSINDGLSSSLDGYRAGLRPADVETGGRRRTTAEDALARSLAARAPFYPVPNGTTCSSDGRYPEYYLRDVGLYFSHDPGECCARHFGEDAGACLEGVPKTGGMSAASVLGAVYGMRPNYGGAAADDGDVGGGGREPAHAGVTTVVPADDGPSAGKKPLRPHETSWSPPGGSWTAHDVHSSLWGGGLASQRDEEDAATEPRAPVPVYFQDKAGKKSKKGKSAKAKGGKSSKGAALDVMPGGAVWLKKAAGGGSSPQAPAGGWWSADRAPAAGQTWLKRPQLKQPANGSGGWNAHQQQPSDRHFATPDAPQAPPEEVETYNYCGLSWMDATRCADRCPTGDPAECPGDEGCYADVNACEPYTVRISPGTDAEDVAVEVVEEERWYWYDPGWGEPIRCPAGPGTAAAGGRGIRARRRGTGATT